jgi:TRAP-type transport system periplasmic protein
MQILRRRILGAAGITALAPVWTNAAAAAGGGGTMKLSTATLNDVQHEWLRRFSAAVSTASAGRLHGEIYPASQLGSIPRMIEGVQFGSIQAWAGPPQFLAGIDPRYQMPSAPGIFRDGAHAHRALQDPEFNAAFLALGADRGLKGVGLYVLGPTGIVTRTRAAQLADLAGRKIRVLAADMDREEMRQLKATPVPMALGEVLPALQQGALDGVMSSLPVVAPMRYYDSARFYLETNHAMVVSISVVSKTWFDKLEPDLQKIVVDAGQQISRDIIEWSLKDYERARQTWIDAGGEVNTLPQAEQQAIAKAMAPIGAEVSARKPAEKAMFDLLAAAARRTAG